MATVFINEFHYDNSGTDTGEFIEIAGLAGTDLSNWQLVLYNGANGSVYDTISLTGTLTDDNNGFGFITVTFPSNGIQNGAPDGIALVDNADSANIQFISYEGVLTAVDGPAAGLTSTDIGVSESGSTPGGFSLQLTGTGDEVADFTWAAPASETPGGANNGQTFTAGPATANVFISEIHYDNVGADEGEFIEVTADADTDLTGYSLVLYNGNDGGAYNTVNLSGVVSDEGSGQGAIAFDIPGIQNGAPDGVALVAADDSVVEFLSYEGILTAADGPAVGLTSTDIGVQEGSSTPIGQSLQLIDGVWTGPAEASRGEVNTGDNGGGNGDAEFKFIHEIQGNEAASPILGQQVMVEAIVVGDFQDGAFGTNGDLNGFLLQEEDGDIDSDSLTSEGIFVFDGSSPNVDVSAGDRVSVTGFVTEFFGETQLSNVTVTVIDSSNNSGDVTPATVTLPVASTTVNADGALIADLEAFEGMLVTLPQELTVSDLFTLGRFGDIGLYADGRLETFTQANAPSVEGFQTYQDLAVRHTVILDDGSTVQNPPTIPFEVASAPGNVPGQLDAKDELRAGDTITNLTGVVRFGRGSGGSGDEIYRINPIETPVFTNSNPRPTEAPDVGGDITVASFNVLNFFTTLDDGTGGSGPNDLEPRGAESPVEFDRQVAKLVAALSEIEADIFGLIELENEFGDQNGDGQFAIGFLVDALNQAIEGVNYQFVDPGQGFIDTGDAISVGLIYNANTVEIAEGTSIEILTDSDLAGLGVDPGNPVFDGAGTSRAPLAATFEDLTTGETFTVAVNHFKSKGSISPFGNNAGTGDGTGNNNETRLQAAIALDAWLDTDPTNSGDGDVLIIGDLNAYGMEDPIQFLLDEGYENQVRRFLETGDFEYSFGFPLDLDTSPQVQAFGALDYALANESLARQITGAAEWHINADEASVFDYNTNFKPEEQIEGLFAPDPFRAADHDPLIIGLNLSSSEPINEIIGTNRRDVLTGTDGADRIEGRRGLDTINGGDGDDIIIGGLGADVLAGGGGIDTFVFETIRERVDVIRDFNLDEDLIDFRAIFSGQHYNSTTPYVDYINLLNFGLGTSTTVTVDPNGDRRNRFDRPLVVLEGVTPDQLSADNFLV